MTTTEARNLIPGTYVNYMGIRAMVLAVKTNGINITFWGKGLQEGKSVTRTVAACYIDKENK